MSDLRRPPRDPGALLLDAYTIFFGIATIFYEAILFLMAPSWCLAVTICLSAPLAIFIALRARDASPPGSAIADTPTLLVILGGAVGFSLFIAAVNLDDYLFFHRALLQLGHLSEPISRTTDFLDVPAPALSNAHILSAFEPVFALLGYGLRLDPLWFIDNLVSAWFVALFCIAALALYKQVGLGRAHRLAALVAIILFCFLDLSPERSYGNLLLYMQNGKCILWSSWITLAIYYSLRYSWRPSIYNYVVLFFCHASAVGYSGSGTYMSPCLALAMSLALLVGRGPQGVDDRGPGRIVSTAILMSAALVPLALGGAIASGVWPLPQNRTVWETGFPADWFANLALLIHGPLDGARIVLGVLLPWVTLKAESARILSLYAIFLVVLLFNPWVGPLLVSIVLPASYWRLAFLFPQLIMVGLVGPLALDAYQLERSGRQGARRQWAFVGGSLCLLLAGPLLNPHAISAGLRTLFIKSAASSRLPPDEERFADRIRPFVKDRIVLSSENVGAALGQVSPTTRFLWNRGAQHLFQGVISPASIDDRAALSVAAGRCETKDVSRLAGAVEAYAVTAFALGPSPICALVAGQLAAQLGSKWSVIGESPFALVLRGS